MARIKTLKATIETPELELPLCPVHEEKMPFAKERMVFVCPVKDCDLIAQNKKEKNDDIPTVGRGQLRLARAEGNLYLGSKESNVYLMLNSMDVSTEMESLPEGGMKVTLHLTGLVADWQNSDSILPIV